MCGAFRKIAFVALAGLLALFAPSSESQTTDFEPGLELWRVQTPTGRNAIVMNGPSWDGSSIGELLPGSIVTIESVIGDNWLRIDHPDVEG